MNMSSIANNLPKTNNSALDSFDEMQHAIEATTVETELVIIAGNSEVHEVIKGNNLTKQTKKFPTNKKIMKWKSETQTRYSRYIDFVEDSKCDYPLICKNINLINKAFISHVISFQNLIRLVQSTDKMIIHVLKNFDIIE